MGARRWAMHYGVAIALASFLAFILGQIPLFRETSVGKLRASDLVQFIGYGGAMTMAWAAARVLATNPPAEWKWIMPYLGIVIPLVTMFSIGIAYGLLLFVLGPFLGRTSKGIYNWIFIVMIVSNGVWLIINWMKNCAPLVATKETPKVRKAA